MKRIFWLSECPSPYHSSLYRKIHLEGKVKLKIFYNRRSIKSHPWKQKFNEGYDYFGINNPINRLLIIIFHINSLLHKNTTYIIAGWNSFSNIFILLLLIFFRKRYIILTDTPILNKNKRNFINLLRKWLLNLILSRAFKVFTTGIAGIQEFLAWGIEKEKIVNFPCTIDLDFFKPKTGVCEKKELNLMSSGIIKFDIKGQDTVLMAIKEIENINPSISIVYSIAGSGPDYHKVLRIVKEHEIKSEIRLLGWLEQESLITHLHRADIFIHPSPVHEPFGVAVLEAMAVGLPVIATNLTCAALDRIENEINGFIFAPNNFRELSKIILKLYKNKDQMKKIGTAARKKSEEWPQDYCINIINNI